MLLAGASLLALAGGPALAAPCVPSTRTITTSVAGPVDTDGGILTVTNTGAVTNTPGTAIQASCPAIRIDNAGSILGFTGVEVPHAIPVDSLTNAGSITGGGGQLGRGIGINNDGTIGQLTNNGSIRGGGSIGVYNTGSINALNNTGLLSAVGGTAIENVGGIVRQKGKLKPLAYGGPTRSPQLPSVPTLREMYQIDQILGVGGVLAPAGTPAPAVSWVNRELIRVMKTPEFMKLLDPFGFFPIGNSPEEYANSIRAEVSQTRELLRKYPDLR